MSGRFATIDGLRGYLASGVLISHGNVWYHFLHTGVWTVPSSNFYTNLGQASVVMFFMITGFLFWSKLLQGRSKPINWYQLYLSRFLRLVPLYAFTMALLVFTIGILTNFHLKEPAFALSKDVLRWGSFTVLGAPTLNGVEETFLITAGVTWTLRYEWLFYFFLPLMATLVGALPPRRFIVGSLLVVGWICYHLRLEPIYLAAFGGGIVASSLVHLSLIHGSLRGHSASAVALVSLLVEMTFFPTAYQIFPIFLLSITFTIIAGGNTLFGILVSSASRFLGQLTYSIYLLHGIILFWTFRFIIHFPRAALYSVTTHWLIIWLCIPIVIVICYATFRWIELPGMKCTSKMSRRFFTA